MSAHKQKKQHKESPAASAGTLRDDFAKFALLALCHATLDDEGQAGDVARRAYLLADAMLEMREPPDEGAGAHGTHSTHLEENQ